MMDRVEALRVFLSVAEHGSFTEASRRLGVSPGQVSKQIAALEAQLKKRLFERSTRAVRLTDEGEGLISTAQQIVDQMDSLTAGNAVDETDASGLVRITAPVIYGARRLAPLLSRFLSEHPNISIRLSLSDRKVDLVEDGYDLAVRIGTPNDSGLIGRRLATERLRLMASDSYIQKHGTPTSPQELQLHECVIDLNVAQPRRWRFTKDGETVDVRVNGRFESDSAEAVGAAAEAGLGIAQTPQWCIETGNAPSGMQYVLTDWEAPQPEVWLLWPPGPYLPHRVRRVVDALADYLKSG